MSKMGMTLEIELGITGGEEDGVDNSDVDSSKLYTQPDEVVMLTKNFQNKPSIYNSSCFWKRTRQTRK
jgi:fructose/tagatose bisphosphate aldolase